MNLVQIFRDALDLEPAARTPYLDQLALSPTLRAELNALLAAVDADPSMLPPPALHFASDQSRAHDRTGTVLATFRLQSLIGEGGMGQVWRATREDEFAQTVAIKLAFGAGLSELARARFAQERELLARLHHPGIAAIYDGGTDQGVPWYAMEYVDGLPLDQYIAMHQPSLLDRLRLIIKLTEAVHYAHQHLIVHRDLKPNNVLVQADGAPKLLDFGIAKRLDDQLGITQSRAPLTFAYAAPEQIRGEMVTTASDVYSLGVLLFEVLTGERPHKGNRPQNAKGDADAALSLLQAITDTDAPAPSKIASQRNKDSTTLDRKGKQATLAAHQLQGDLDTIVLKALSRDPARRYASAFALQEDLQRFIDGMPIQARPDTLGYRFGKLIRRHKIASAVATVALVSLLSLLVLLWRQVQIAERQSLIAQQQSQIAKQQADAARKAQTQAETALETQALLREHFFVVLTKATASAEPIDPDALLALSVERQVTKVSNNPAAERALLLSLAALAGRRKDEIKLKALLDQAAPLMATAPASELLEYQVLQGALAANSAASATTGNKDLATTQANGSTSLPMLIMQAQLAAKLGDKAKALAFLETAVKQAENAPDNDQLMIAAVYGNQSRLALDIGAWELAESSAIKAVALFTQQGVYSEPVPTLQLIPPSAAIAIGRVAHAVDLIARAGIDPKKINPAQRGSIANVQARVAFWLAQHDKAQALAEQSRTDLCGALSQRSNVCRIAHYVELEFAIGMQQGDRARGLLKQIQLHFPDDAAHWQIYQSLLGQSDPDLADAELAEHINKPTNATGMALAMQLQQKLILARYCKAQQLPRCARAATDVAMRQAKELALPADSIFWAILSAK